MARRVAGEPETEFAQQACYLNLSLSEVDGGTNRDYY